jgi:choline dehydrogenase
VRSTDPKLFSVNETPTIAEDSSSGPGAPDLEVIFICSAFLRQWSRRRPPGYYWSMRACLLRYSTVEIYLLSHRW